MVVINANRCVCYLPVSVLLLALLFGSCQGDESTESTEGDSLVLDSDVNDLFSPTDAADSATDAADSATDAADSATDADTIQVDVPVDAGEEVDIGCPDDDSDGVCNADDVCDDGDDLQDADEDGVPDACDACEEANDGDDADEDGVPDACDICPAGDDAIDTDEDGTPDACDCDVAGDDCHANAFCVPIDDGIECQCLTGYQGDGVTACDNTNECSADTSPCVAGATCEDNDGSFTCSCALGSYGNAYAGGACDPCDASCLDCTAAGPTG